MILFGTRICEQMKPGSARPLSRIKGYVNRHRRMIDIMTIRRRATSIYHFSDSLGSTPTPVLRNVCVNRNDVIAFDRKRILLIDIYAAAAGMLLFSSLRIYKFLERR
jgi:hypothetical protein